MKIDPFSPVLIRVFLCFCVLGKLPVWAGTSTNEIRIIELQGQVEVSPAGATTWVLTQTNQVLHPFDRVRTGPNSRMALRWSDRSVVPFSESTELEILPPDRTDSESGLHLVRGVISFFHRDQPGRIRIITRGAVAGIEGTELVLFVDVLEGVERTLLSVVDGRVSFGNGQETLIVTNGQQALVQEGKRPAYTGGFIANNVLQWCFYYPAVLDLQELPLTASEQHELQDSLEAYQAGDIPMALARYPDGGQLSSAKRVYYAALLLSVGQASKAEAVLEPVRSGQDADRSSRLAEALRELIRAVQDKPGPSQLPLELATEFLAHSYLEQSQARPGVSLENALQSARKAAVLSPRFSYAWARLGELEMSFGRRDASMDAVEKSLAIGPRNPEALALKGFLLADQNRRHEAIAWFDRSLSVDGALGNAWLGRGLCRIGLGDLSGGKEDLLVAAALEPRRAVLRSYLAKAYDAVRDYPRASKELELAKALDANDPTAWLYSALLNQENNRINDGIRDLERSKELNDNRSVYRSGLLLDQDRAVRSANLASLYRDAGMSDVAIREAVRSVNSDYANYSAHLFLANGYSDLRDPNLINLRYETPSSREYLLANLLSPVSPGTMSPIISQQEYFRLFERNRVGAASQTEYLSRGAWTQSGSQYGTFDSFGYAVDAFYRSDPGQRFNDDVDQRVLSLTLKEEITPVDIVFAQVTHQRIEAGDVRSYYSPGIANPGVRTTEDQDPNLVLGYHHEWGPGVHTLFLFARLDDTLSFTNQEQPTIVAFRPDIDPIAQPGVTRLAGVTGMTMHENFRGNLGIYSGEIQQIVQQASHSTVLGATFQYGHFRSSSLQNNPSEIAIVFPDPPQPAGDQDVRALFRRISLYGYHSWQIAEPLDVTAGLAYDQITFPENVLIAPLSGQDESKSAVSPKAGFIWTPARDTAVRFAYTRSLGGASFEQNYRLEPSQVAGFIQAYRSLIPESVAGNVAGTEFETYNLSFEQKLRSETYLGVSGEILSSKATRVVGAFDFLPDEFDFALPSGIGEALDYRERSLLFTINQLIGRDWAFGARYRLRACFENGFES
jgi:tetratricopeptide (TPR) repeat protein